MSSRALGLIITFCDLTVATVAAERADHYAFLEKVLAPAPAKTAKGKTPRKRKRP